MRTPVNLTEYPIDLSEVTRKVHPVINHLLNTRRLMTINDWSDILKEDVILDLDNQTLGVVEDVSRYFVTFTNSIYVEGMTSVLSKMQGGVYVILE